MFRCNHVVAIGFRRVPNSTTETVSMLGKNLVKDSTRFNFEEIISSSVQDGAAKSVPKKWNLEVETCDMHDSDKIGASAVGRLVRKDGKKNVVNPYPSGIELDNKLNLQAKHFSACHANRQRYAEIIGSAPAQLPSTMIKQDTCGTRMSSYHELVRSSIRVKRSLELYLLTHRNEPNSSITPYLTDADWKFAFEVEAILNISKAMVTISQNEVYLNAAYGPVVRNVAYKKLTSEKMLVIDEPNWGKTRVAPRIEINVDTFTDNGKECRERAILECERRFFGHDGNISMYSQGASPNIKLSEREKATLILDKRTCLQTSVLKTIDEWVEARNCLEKYYIDFYVNRGKYEREIAQNSEEPASQASSCGPQSLNTFKIEDFEDDDDGNTEDVNNSNNEPEAVEVHEDDQIKIDSLNAKKEFKKVVKEWWKWTPDWKSLYPERVFTYNEDGDGNKICDPNPFTDLIDIDMSRLMQEIVKYNTDNGNVFGYLPLM